MDIILEPLIGPLGAVECRRSLSRGWVLVLRALAVWPPALVALGVLWVWWFQGQFVSHYSPAVALSWGLILVEAMLVTVALLLGQALLAGTFAGEKHPSTAALLAAQVSPLEIVFSRLMGRLCVVALIFLAGLPILAGFSALCGNGALILALLIALPVAVAFGGGGLALAVSTVTRTARDALLVVYLFEVLLLFAPLLGHYLAGPSREWIDPLNPYQGIGALAASRDLVPALTTIGMWTLIGILGCAWATWRLRPAYLNAADGPKRRWSLLSFWRGPAVTDRPMLWKELHIEQAHSFSRIVKWLGILAVAAYSGTCLLLSALVAWGTWIEDDPDGVAWALSALSDLLSWSWLTAWLIQWALGLRAAASITSERMRGTWDALLVSPLHASEIVWAKIYGSIYGLRALLGSLILVWTAGLLCGALAAGDYVELLAQALLVGSFMTAVGVLFSLLCESSTRAMTGTILAWIGAACVFLVIAGTATFVVMMVWILWYMVQAVPPPGPIGSWPGILFQVVRFALYGSAAVVIAICVRQWFDSLAGRSTASGPERRMRNRRDTERGELTSRNL
ncbi:MAG TPA: hypothetical protein VFE62_28405 [Gemmataceae bacterium]|nr:hypothetical protein [Gemmataceae bacterium]